MPINEQLFLEMNRWASKKDVAALDFAELQKFARLAAEFNQIEIAEKDLSDTISDLIDHFAVTSKEGSTVSAKEFKPWFEKWRQENSTPRWDRYRKYLLEIKGWSPAVVDRLDSETSQLVDLVGDPSAEGEWSRRGLAIGEVQSGKTANYIGVLNKALDSGYKLIIILGGHTNDLRRQTQERVDSDLLGFDTNYQAYESTISAEGRGTATIGVGRLDASIDTPHRLTSVLGDFSKSNKSTQGVTLGPHPTVAVIKKHAGTLNNLASYLHQQTAGGRIDLPMIVVDDESDWASVNTRDDDDPVAVNKAIRALLKSCRKTSYLAFTATPFANVFIDSTVDEDLFPKDYIRSLPSPSNYMGAFAYHSREAREKFPHRLQTDVHDVLEQLPYGHRGRRKLVSVPESLERAIHAFLIGTAARRVRDGRVKPASMMINVSNLNSVQTSVFEQVNLFVETLTSTLSAELTASLPSESRSVSRVRETFERVFPGLSNEIAWQGITAPLQDVSRDVHCQLVNGTTTKSIDKYISTLSRSDRVDYQNRPVIKVGGNVLSRGITLEGLQVSYFTRRAGAADTLLQMGRWFGYRTGYDDLVRVWIDEDVVELFDYAREISDELRASVGEMKRLELTPMDFGLKVRMHPESFRITAANKLRNGEVIEEVYAPGSIFSTLTLSYLEDDRKANTAAADTLVDRLETSYPTLSDRARETAPRNLWRNIPSGVIREFLEGYRAPLSDPYFGPETPGGRAQLIKVLDNPQIGAEWDVRFIEGEGREERRFGSAAFSINVRPSIRNSMSETPNSTVTLGNRRLSAANDLMNTLTPAAVTKALQAFATAKGESIDRVSKGNMSERFIARAGLERPTLLIYSLSLSNDREPKSPGDRHAPDLLGQAAKSAIQDPRFGLVALAIAFPSDPDENLSIRDRRGATRFVANTVHQQFARMIDEPGDDDLDEE